MKKLIVCIALSAISTGCALENSSSVDQSRIYTTYSAKAVGSSVKAEAEFNFGKSLGTGLQLDGDSTVSFNEEKMTGDLDPILNIMTYRSTRNMAPSDQTLRDHSFTYRNNNGQVFTNKFRFPSGVSASYSATTLSISSSFKATWSSQTAVNDDAVELVYTGSSQSKGYSGSAPMTKNSDGRSGELVWNQEKLADFGKGTMTVEICRVGRPSIQEAPDAGGSLRVRTCSDQTTLTLTD